MSFRGFSNVRSIFVKIFVEKSDRCFSCNLQTFNANLNFRNKRKLAIMNTLILTNLVRKFFYGKVPGSILVRNSTASRQIYRIT